MLKKKAWLSKYKHAWLLSYFFLYFVWFFYLEQRTSVEYTSIQIGLDFKIPFCEYFIIPYLLWFLYIAGTITYFFFTDVSDYYRCCAFLFIGMTICLIIYTIFPNEQNLRPMTFERHNIFTDMVQGIYNSDTSTNVCPSIHVFNSIGIFLCIAKSQRLKNKKGIKLSAGILTVLICLSTVFLKQHSVFDGICAIGLACVMYVFVYKVNYQKLFSRDLLEQKDMYTKKKWRGFNNT